MLKKEKKMVSFKAPKCTNWANIILQHDQNRGIFNVYNIFKTLSNIQDDEAYWETRFSQNSSFKHSQAYSEIFINIQAFSGISRDIKAYWGIFRHWGILSHIQTYSKVSVALAYITMSYSEPWHIQYLRHLQKLVKRIRWSGIIRALA